MKNLITIFLLFITSNLFAQQDVEMADKLREDGKIWVVVAIIFVTFLGLAIYLFTIDRKVSKIEKKLNIDK
ncbi:MAG: CcmD family protein [Spirosomataceae bacterium]